LSMCYYIFSSFPYLFSYILIDCKFD
jgi:hypothetical protein